MFSQGSRTVPCGSCGTSGVKTCHVCNGTQHVKWYLQILVRL